MAVCSLSLDELEFMEKGDTKPTKAAPRIGGRLPALAGACRHSLPLPLPHPFKLELSTGALPKIP